MIQWMIRGIAFVVGVVVVMSIYWLGGGEFERGEGLALTSVLSLFIGGFLSTCPAFDDL